ncbi:MAG: SAM-dependent methyltransferase [Muribaculaceae bacterium]|nr:SAM-dependent methyltransferase [Muribaculaceae bacterium]
MTPEEIKKIAEEYADMYMERYIPQVSKKDNIRNTFIREAMTILIVLTERYYLIEKGKAKALQAEILCAIMNAHDDDDMQMVAHEVLDVMPRRFAAVFGSEIGKEEE